MSLIPVALICVLVALAALHLYWGFGGFWPGTDGKTLSERVAGTSRNVASKLSSCAMVSAALLAAAAIVVAGQVEIAGAFPALIVLGGYAVLILVFALRGLAPYLTPAFNYARATPFFELNRRYYAPLCLLIAAGLIASYPAGLAAAFDGLFG
ncbi:MAG TPA: DUF3995 domain-containing protein [Hyphomonadaceae bacterium]|jgi:hypothetical protein|nr:DUF3995 domain-containing protein [Hyphomonadaceae bacterium]